MMQDRIQTYQCKVVEEETRFRDLFGGRELKEARAEYYERYMQTMVYLDYLYMKTEKKLKEQDNDEENN